VKEGSSAAEKGIEEGDVITSVISNHKIQPMASVQAFRDLASKTEELAVKVQRGPLSRFVTLSKTAK
jgi:S1-C subfamily serine protease